MRKTTKWAGLVLAVAVFFAGCGLGDAGSYVKDHYQFESVSGTGNEQQKVYRAPNQTVPQTAQQIASNDKPDEMSKQDDKDMFLVYPDSVIHVQQDAQKTSDSLVEVDSKEYVKQHYDPGFLEGYLAATLISNIFGSNWRSYPHGDYRGYTEYRYRYPSGGGTYKSPSGSYSGGRSGGSYSTPSTPPRSGGGFTTPPRSGGGTGKVIRRGK